MAAAGEVAGTTSSRFGRAAVEAAQARYGHHDPSRNVPFPTTRELFQLEWQISDEERAAYLAAEARVDLCRAHVGLAERGEQDPVVREVLAASPGVAVDPDAPLEDRTPIRLGSGGIDLLARP